MFALFINAAILVMAAATFHGTGHEDVADIGDAYKLLSPLLGTTMASMLFAVALLCSGQNATLTGTLAGQIVMEGFINLRLRPWLRRLITRLIAIVPAIIVIALYGERGTGPLLILSQVILSLQLPFAVFPLVMFTERSAQDGRVRRTPAGCKALAWTVAVIIAALNVWLLYQTFAGCYDVSTHSRRHRELRRRRHDPRRTSRELARLTGAELLLVHVADGWAARHFDELKLRESEEMKADRDVPRSSFAASSTARGLTVDTRLAMGDPATELIEVVRGAGRRSDRHVHARPPLRQRRPARRDRRQRPAPGQGPGPAAARAVDHVPSPEPRAPAQLLVSVL